MPEPATEPMASGIAWARVRPLRFSFGEFAGTVTSPWASWRSSTCLVPSYGFAIVMFTITVLHQEPSRRERLAEGTGSTPEPPQG